LADVIAAEKALPVAEWVEKAVEKSALEEFHFPPKMG
jgi:hypothetical protein